MYPFNRFIDKADDAYDRQGLADIPVFTPASDERERVLMAYDRRRRATRRAVRRGLVRRYLRHSKGVGTLVRRTFGIVSFGVLALPLAILALIAAPIMIRFADWRASRVDVNSRA